MAKNQGVSYDDFNSRPKGVSYQDFDQARTRYARSSYSATQDSRRYDNYDSRYDSGAYGDDYYNQQPQRRSGYGPQPSYQQQTQQPLYQPEYGQQLRSDTQRRQTPDVDRRRTAGGSGGTGRSGGSGGTSKPRKKKKHPFLKFLLVVIILAAAAFGAKCVLDNMKDDLQWRAEYTGTWQVQAIGNTAHPVISIGGSLILGGATDMNSNMILGITSTEGQIVNFGMHKDYAFALDKDTCTFTAVDGTKLEGRLVFGHLIVKDGGTMTLYEKISNSYTPITGDNKPDIDAILDIAAKVASSAGDAGSQALEMLNQVDRTQLEQYLKGTDPSKIQEMIGEMDPQAVVDLVTGSQNVQPQQTQPAPEQQAQPVPKQQPVPEQQPQPAPEQQPQP